MRFNEPRLLPARYIHELARDKWKHFNTSHGTLIFNSQPDVPICGKVSKEGSVLGRTLKYRLL